MHRDAVGRGAVQRDERISGAAAEDGDNVVAHAGRTLRADYARPGRRAHLPGRAHKELVSQLR